jgi:hypothetical protein
VSTGQIERDGVERDDRTGLRLRKCFRDAALVGFENQEPAGTGQQEQYRDEDDDELLLPTARGVRFLSFLLVLGHSSS